MLGSVRQLKTPAGAGHSDNSDIVCRPAQSPLRSSSALDESSFSQAETAKKKGKKGLLDKNFDERGDRPSTSAKKVHASMTLEMHETETVRVDHVISRLHTVRSCMKEHTDTNEALLQSLTERLGEGQKAVKHNMSEAMGAIERQRQETMLARAESKKFQDALLISQHELTKALEDKIMLAGSREEIAKCERNLAMEHKMRAALQVHHETVLEELKIAIAQLQAQEGDLEIMCEDLAGAEEKLEITRLTVDLLQAESRAHQQERKAEQQVVSRLTKTQGRMEQTIKSLADELSRHLSDDQKLSATHQMLQHKLNQTFDQVYSLEGEVASANAKLHDREDRIAEMRSDLHNTGADFEDLRVQMLEAVREFESAQVTIDSLEMLCQQGQGREEHTKKALKQSQHELSESMLALKHIHHVACGDTSSNVGLQVVRTPGDTHSVQDAAIKVQHSHVIMVKTVAENGAAADGGQVFPGHILHQIDGHDVSMLSVDQVDRLLAGPVGSRVLLVAQCGLEGVQYETTLMRKVGGRNECECVSRQASSVCQVFHGMRDQLGALQQAHARTVFELSRQSEAEERRVVGTWSAIKDCVAGMEGIAQDLQKERGIVASTGGELEVVHTEYQAMETRLLHTIDELTKTAELSCSSTKKAEDSLQRQSLEFEQIKIALGSEKQKVAGIETQLNEKREELQKLSVANALGTRQADDWKEKVLSKTEEWQAARSECAELRQALAKRAQDLADCKAVMVQVHRAVCGKFQKTGIGIQLRVAKHNGSMENAAMVDEITPGGAADSSGKLVPGDIVLSIDGVDASSMSEDVIKSKLAGPVGLSIVMSVRRNTESREFQLTLIRRPPSVDKLSMSGVAAEVCDCAHALFVEMQQLSSKYATVSSFLEVHTMSMADMQTVNCKLKTEYGKAGDDIRELHTQIEVLEKDLANAYIASTGMHRKIARGVLESDGVTKQLANANEKISKLGTQFEAKQQELYSERSRHQQATKESAGLVAELRGEIGARSSKISLMKLEIERLKSESMRHLLESDSVKKQILLLRDTNEELKVRLMQSREEKNRLLQHLETEQQRSTSTQSKLTIALAGSQRLDLQKSGVSWSLAELEQKHEDALDHTRLMLERLEEAQHDLQTYRADIVRLENDKQDLEEARCQANASLEQALAEIEMLREEAEKASIRLKSELEKAGNVVQEQAHVHASVLQEKSIIECHLSAAKERIASIDGVMQNVSTDCNVLKARVVDFEHAMLVERLKVDQGLEREADQDTAKKALQHEITDVLLILQAFSEDADHNLAESVRRLIRMCQSGADEMSRLGTQLAKLQEAMLHSSAEIHRLEELRGHDAEVAQEMQCEKHTLETKMKLLSECLSKEIDNSTTTRNTNETIAADLRDARSQNEQSRERCNSVQVEHNQISRDHQERRQESAELQKECDVLSGANLQLQHNLMNLQEQDACKSALLTKSEAALLDSQLQAKETAQKLTAVDKVRKALSEQNFAFSMQLQHSAVRGKEVLELIAIMHSALKDNEKFSLEQCFEVVGLQNELSVKRIALDDMHYAMMNAERDREQVMITTIQMETLTKQRAADVCKFSLVETKLRQLSSSCQAAQEELQGMVLDISAAIALVQRQIGYTISALSTATKRSCKKPAESQGNLVNSLTQLETLHELLHTQLIFNSLEQKDKAAEVAARLQLQVSQAHDLIACLEQDRDRNSDELHSEKGGNQVLLQKLHMSECQVLDGQRTCSELEQRLVVVRGDRDATQRNICSAVEGILRLVREAMRQGALAKDFFTVSHNELCNFTEVCTNTFARAVEDVQCIESGMEDERNLNNTQNTQLVAACEREEKAEGELLSFKSGLASIQGLVSLQVHALCEMLEIAKDDARQAAWKLEEDCSSLKNFAKLKAAELEEARRQLVLGKAQLHGRDVANGELATQLQDVESLAEARQDALEDLYARLQQNRKETEDAMKASALVQVQLVRTVQEQDDRTHEATAAVHQAVSAQHEIASVKVRAEDTLTKLRTQMHAHTSSVQERIMALQVESEGLHLEIAGIHTEFGLLRADFQRQVTALNSRVLEYEDDCRSMRAALEHQERELAYRQTEATKLETLVCHLQKEEGRQQEAHLQQQFALQACAMEKMHSLKVHVAEKLRMQRKLVWCIHNWRGFARRKTWAVSAAFDFASSVSSSLLQGSLRRWTRKASSNHRRTLRSVARWELLVVGATVCTLDRRAQGTKSPGALSGGVKQKMYIASPHKMHIASSRSSDGGLSFRSHHSNQSSINGVDGMLDKELSSCEDTMFPHGMSALRLNLNPHRMRTSNGNHDVASAHVTSQQQQSIKIDMTSSAELSSCDRTLDSDVRPSSPKAD